MNSLIENAQAESEKKEEGFTPLRSPDASATITLGDIIGTTARGVQDRELDKRERTALWLSSVDLLNRTDTSALDDAGKAGLWMAAANGMMRSISGKDLSISQASEMFGSRAASDWQGNIELLRRFAKGEWQLMEDPEAEKWRAKLDEGEEAAAFYASEQLGGWNQFKRDLKGETGTSSLLERMAEGQPYMGVVGKTPGKESKELRLSYDDLDEEEKAQWRKSAIDEYEKRLARGKPVMNFLKMTHDFDDNAKRIVRDAWHSGTINPLDLERYPEEMQERILAAVSTVRGDLQKGSILWIDTRLDENGFVGELKRDLYSLQHSLQDIIPNAAKAGQDLVDWVKAWRKSGKEREEAFRKLNLNAAIDQALKQDIQEPDSFAADVARGLAENAWFFVTGGAKAAAKGTMAVAQGVKNTAKMSAVAKELIHWTPWKAGKAMRATAELASKNAAEIKKSIDALNASMGALDKKHLASLAYFTNALRNQNAIAAAARTRAGVQLAKWFGGKAVLDAARLAEFGSFFREYVDDADAHGVSREDSIPTGVFVGAINALVENLYVPGQSEKAISPQELKHLMWTSLLPEIRDRGFKKGFSEWAANYLAKTVAETAKVYGEEALIEEPIQQLVESAGIRIDKTREKLREEGRGDAADVLGNLWQQFATPEAMRNIWATYVEAAAEASPASFGFGITSLGHAKLRQHALNMRYGADVALADLVQKGLDAQKALQAFREEAQEAQENPNAFMEAMTAARNAYRNIEGGDGVSRIAQELGVDVKTAEVVASFLDAEAEMLPVSPRARALKDTAFAKADINEDTIQSIATGGYVKGSFLADKENGVFSARVKIGEGENATEKTIVYRIGDMSQFVTPEMREQMMKEDSAFGASWTARRREEGKEETWQSIGDEGRKKEVAQFALNTNGFLADSKEKGEFELKDSQGKSVTISADAIINLASGRTQDLGYSAAASMATARHETFHALWRFVRETMSDEDIRKLKEHFGIDPTAKESEQELDEAMAPQFENYASGHYVPPAVSSSVDAFARNWAVKMMDFLGKLGVDNGDVRDPATGKAYTLESFYKAVTEGRIGSGALGVTLAKLPAKPQTPTAQAAGAQTSGASEKIPVPPAAQAEAAKTAQAEANAEALAATAKEPAQEPLSAQSATIDAPAEPNIPGQKFYRVALPNSPVKLVGELEVVDAQEGINTSTDENYSDRGNQNRDDKNEESRALVEKIGANPDPMQIGTVQPMANNGIVWALPNGDVIIGNHRVNGVRLGYEKGTAGNLENFVRDEAAKRGIEISENVKRPLLVFRLRRIESPDGKTDVHEVVRLANESQNRGFNAHEQAANDAKILIDGKILQNMEFTPEGKIDEAASADAIGAFRRATGMQGMLDEKGFLTEDGSKRIERAALAALLGSTGQHSELLAKLTRDYRSLDMLPIFRALMRETPAIIELAARKPIYDLRNALAEALNIFIQWRDRDEIARNKAEKPKRVWRETKDSKRVRGLSWQDHNAQQDMFYTPSREGVILGDLFAAADAMRSWNKEDDETDAGKERAYKFITNFIDDFIKGANDANTETEDLLGDEPPHISEVLANQRAKPNPDGSIRFSIKQAEFNRWNSILDDYEAGDISPHTNLTVLERTPEVLKRIGADDLPITMRGGILQKITGEIETKGGQRHGIPVSELRNLQIELDNPIAVFDSITQPDSLVVLTRMIDKENNERAVVALRLDGKGSKGHNINAIASAYGKKKDAIKEWIARGRLRYINKQARRDTARWLQLPGDATLRARHVLTEKDFTDEQLGHIVPYSPASRQGGNGELFSADNPDIRYSAARQAESIRFAVKSDLRPDGVLYNVAEKFWNDGLAKTVNDAKSLDDVQDALKSAGDGIVEKYMTRPARVSPSRIQQDAARVQAQDPEQMRQITSRVGIPFRNDAADYTPEELKQLCEPIAEELTKKRREIGGEWEKALSAYTPATRYLVLRSLYKFISKESEAYPVGYIRQPFEVTMRDFEQAPNPAAFNFYNAYNDNIINFIGEDKEAVVKVEPEKGVPGTWVRMPKASESKDVRVTKQKVAAASNGTQWCTRYVDSPGTGAMKVIEEDDHDFYVFFPKDTTQAALAIVPVKQGEEGQLKSNPWYTGIFKRSNGSDNTIEPEYYDSVNALAKQTKDPDLAYTLEKMGYAGLTKGEMRELQRRKYAKQIEWMQGRERITPQDFDDIERLFGIALKSNGDDIILHEYNSAIHDQVAEEVREDFWRIAFNSITTIEGGAYLSENTQLPALTTIGGQAVIRENIHLPSLTSIGGGAVIRENAQLPALTSIVGGADIGENAQLPALTSIGGNALIFIGANLPALTSIGGNAFINQNAQLPELQTVRGERDISPQAYTPKLNRSDTRFSLARTNDGQAFVLLDRPNAIDWNNRKAVAEYLTSLVGSGAVSLADNVRIEIGKELPKEYTRSNYAQKAFHSLRLRKLRGKTAQHLDEIIVASGSRKAEPLKHKQREGGVYYRRNVDFGVYGHEVKRGYSAELVSYEKDGQEYLYDLVNIKENPSLTAELNRYGKGGFEILSRNREGLTAHIVPYSPASRQGGNGEIFSAGGGEASPEELRRAVARANAARFSSAKRPNYSDYRDDKPGTQQASQQASRSIADDYDNPYPAIRNLSDDELVASALAVRMALGKSPEERMGKPTQHHTYGNLKIKTVSDMLASIHPDWDQTRLAHETWNVSKKAWQIARGMRGDMDKGVSESLIVKTLPKNLRNQFGMEMGSQARRGAAIGQYGERAETTLEERRRQIVEDAVKVQTGLDYAQFENEFGVDLMNTLLALMHNPWNSAPRGDNREGGSMPLEPEAAGGAAGAEEDGAGGGVARQAIELEDPRAFADTIFEFARRHWVKEHHLGVSADPKGDRVYLQFLRKTAQGICTRLAKDCTYSRGREAILKRIAKLDAIPTSQGLASALEELGGMINARLIRDRAQDMCEKLDRFLREAFGAQGRFKPDKEEGKRKVSAEAELRARYMRHAMWLTPYAAREEGRELQNALDAAMQSFDDAGRDKSQSREVVETIRKLNILREFGALRYKPLAKIEEAQEWWSNQASDAGELVMREILDRDERTIAAAHLLAEAFENPGRSNVRDRSALEDYITGHMGFAALLADCMRFAPEEKRQAARDIIDYITLEVQKAGDQAETLKRRHNGDFRKAVEAAYAKPFHKVLAEMNKEDERFAKFMGTLGGKRITPTKGRAMQLLVSLLQEGRPVDTVDEDGKPVTEWIGGYHDNIVAHKREGQAAEIIKLLSKEDMNMLKWLGAWYEMNRQGLSDVASELFGIGVYAELPNYFPVKMMLEKQGLEKGEGVGWSIFPRALTPRVKNERDFDTSADIFQMWASRMEEGAQWQSHARLGLELRGIFGRQELRSAIAANHGANVDALLQGFITDILTGHGAYDRSVAGVQYFSDKARGWAALCALGGNLGVTMKQTTSIPAFGFEIGLINTARHVVSAFTPDGMAAMRALWNSEQRATRWGAGSSEAVRNALSQDDAGVLKRLMQKAMITNKIGDVIPGLLVGQGIYRDFLERGMSEENAMAATWQLIERTQQSGRMENQTSVQRRNKLGRVMYQFLSTQQQYVQYEIRALRDVAASPRDAKRWGALARTLLLNHFILSSAYFWMGELYKALLGQEPNEDQLKDWVISCLLGAWGSLFVAGFCCKYTLERAIKGYSIRGGSSMLPMEQWLKGQMNDGARFAEAVFSEEKGSWEDIVEAAGKWASDSNATFRDIRKLYQNRISDEPKK